MKKIYIIVSILLLWAFNIYSFTNININGFKLFSSYQEMIDNSISLPIYLNNRGSQPGLVFRYYYYYDIKNSKLAYFISEYMYKIIGISYFLRTAGVKVSDIIQQYNFNDFVFKTNSYNKNVYAISSMGNRLSISCKSNYYSIYLGTSGNRNINIAKLCNPFYNEKKVIPNKDAIFIEGQRLFTIGGNLHNCKNGPWKIWFPNGNLFAEGKIKHKMAHGDWKYYSASNKLIHFQQYTALSNYFGTGNVLEAQTGKSTIYHDNGNIYAIGEYGNGRQIGIWKMFNKDGVQVKEWEGKAK